VEVALDSNDHAFVKRCPHQLELASSARADLMSPDQFFSRPDLSSMTKVCHGRSSASYDPSSTSSFFCTNDRIPPCVDFLLGMFVTYSNSGRLIVSLTTGTPQVVWSTNHSRPIGEDIMAQFTTFSDLVLNSTNGKVVWPAGTISRYIADVSINSE
jgi:hypothetical protein